MPRLCIIPARALSDERVGAMELRVLAAIGYHTSLQGTGAWPNTKTLAARAGMTLRNVRRAVASLAEWGYVRITARYDELGARTSNLYDIILDEELPAQARGVVAQCDRGVVAQDATTVVAHRDRGVVAQYATQTKAVERRQLKQQPASQDFPEFEELWTAYPKRTGLNPKSLAKKAYAKQRDHGITHAEMLAGAKHYARAVRINAMDPKFIPYTATWLNQQLYRERIRIGHGMDGWSDNRIRDFGFSPAKIAKLREWIQHSEIADFPEDLYVD
jgi:hypothetical protein